ncbi:nap family protein [Diplocarpon rosae]|nr:nap family protein [Diplocarpon rosae]
MPQKFAFTTAAMAAALEETPVSYEELAEIERAFDDVETEIIRKQIDLTTPLYASRQKTLSKIPNFWPLVLEQAPPDIDQYIQPSDSALLLSSLSSLSVTHFESSLPEGDPRSVAIRFEFSANEYFEDRVLEKKFWWRRARDGWTGLVSEPVRIEWKKGKDLTGGLGTLVARAWEARSGANGKDKMAEGKEKGGLSAEHKALQKAIDGTSMGGLSFFAWFSFIGRHISAEESAAANALEDRKREARKKGTVVETEVEEEEEEEEDMSLEIFPDGDDLAVAISEDLWPGAIKYFTQAQEQDALSSSDFESDDENDDEKGNENEKGGPSPFHSEPETSDAEVGRPKKKARKE